MTDQVPVAVIAPYIKRWLEKHRANETHLGGYASPVKEGKTEGNLAILGFHTGVSARMLRRILNNKVTGGNTRRPGQTFHVDHISFDLADKIVCGTEGPLAWQTDDALAPYYGPLPVTAGELSKGYELPEGFDLDALPAAKRYGWNRARQAVAA